MQNSSRPYNQAKKVPETSSHRNNGKKLLQHVNNLFTSIFLTDLFNPI